MNGRPMEKLKKWERLKKEVLRIVDGLGMGIDAGIRGTVVALRANGFPTCASCEGHVDWGIACPWVDIQAPEPKGWRRSAKKRDRWFKKNFRLWQKMISLLEEFYAVHRVPYSQMIVAESCATGSFRIMCVGGLGTSFSSLREKRKLLPRYQEEMWVFKQFLKDRFFAN